MPRNAADAQRIITQVTDYVSSIPIREINDFNHAITGLQTIMARTPLPTTLPHAIASQLELLDEYLDPSLAYIEEQDLAFIQPVLQQRIGYLQHLTQAEQVAYIQELQERRTKIEGQQAALHAEGVQAPAQGSEAHVDSLAETYRRLNLWLDRQENNDDGGEVDEAATESTAQVGAENALLDAIINGNQFIINEAFNLMQAHENNSLLSILLRHQTSIIDSISSLQSTSLFEIPLSNNLKRFYDYNPQTFEAMNPILFFNNPKITFQHQDTLLQQAFDVRALMADFGMPREEKLSQSEQFLVESIRLFKLLTSSEQQQIIECIHGNLRIAPLMEHIAHERKQTFFAVYFSIRTIHENPDVFTHERIREVSHYLSSNQEAATEFAPVSALSC